MISGLSPNALYTDSLPCHDFRDPETWQAKPSEGWTTGDLAVESVATSAGAPVRVRVVAAGVETGMHVTFSDVGGTTSLNGKTFTATKVGDDLFDLDDTDGADFEPFTSGGNVAYNNFDSAFMVAPAENPDQGWGQAILISSVWLKMSQNARMHSPLLIIYKAKDGTTIKETVYKNLDDFLDRFTSLVKISVDRYENTIEWYEYLFPQPLTLRTAVAPPGAPMPYFYSVTIKISDDQPYKTEDGGEIEYCRVRYPDVQVHLDQEYSGE